MAAGLAQSPATRRLVAGGQRRARFGSPDTTRPARREDARLVSMENVYMYGRPSGRPLTETRDYAAHTKKGKLRGQMATELLAAHPAGRIGRASCRERV